jgi:hypothetical protein
VTLAPGDLITVTYLKEGLQRQPFRVVRIAPGADYQSMLITAQWHDDDWYTSGGADAGGGRRRPGSGVGLPAPLIGSELDENGIQQFGITERVVQSADGSFTVKLTAEFSARAKPAASSVQIPLVSLETSVDPTGGSIAGDQSLYYAVSALDADGAESGLSFAVRARIPSGAPTFTVTITGLSFSAGTTGFNVYRGSNPIELLRIAENTVTASTFTDAGAEPELVGPPDENYNHANFYWRLELQPEVGAGIYSSTTIGDATLGMLPNDFRGGVARITRGKGRTQERSIVSNTATTLTVTPPWTVTPDATSYFVIAEATWNFGGLGQTSPVNIEVPNRTGATVEIPGRSANIFDRESAAELNPLTRWQIGGAGGGGDADVPPVPVFGLSLVGQGTVDLVGVAFTNLTNTTTIAAGTLSLFYWNELNSPSLKSLASAVDDTATTLLLNAAGGASVGQLVQLESEVVAVMAVGGGGSSYTVERGSHGSTAAAHDADAPVYHLTRHVTIVPFVKGFFGSPASGSHSHSVFLPDTRIAAAELFATNAVGGGGSAHAAFGATEDQGLRTMSGGQYSIQVDGYLATQTDAAPPLVMDATRAARDLFAVVREAPDGDAIEMQLRLDETVYATLTIADGATTSNVVSGFGLPALEVNARLILDITSVPAAANTLPGRDLTVIVRL